MKKTFRYLLLCASFTGIAAAANGVSANGVVLDASGRPVPNAVVLARKNPIGSGSPDSPFRFKRVANDVDHFVTATSGPDGSFTLQNLMSARYSLCVEFPDQSFEQLYLDWRLHERHGPDYPAQRHQADRSTRGGRAN